MKYRASMMLLTAKPWTIPSDLLCTQICAISIKEIQCSRDDEATSIIGEIEISPSGFNIIVCTSKSQ